MTDPTVKYASMKDRILANVRVGFEATHADQPCWFWTGSLDRGGYPTMCKRWKSGPRKGKNRTIRVHREVVKIFTGRTVRKDYVVRHMCNTRCCVNPAHLKGGTQSQNVQDCIRSGRHYTPFRRKTDVVQQENDGSPGQVS